MNLFCTFSIPPSFLLLLLLLSIYMRDGVSAAKEEAHCPGEDSVRGCHGQWNVTKGYADFSASAYPPKGSQNDTSISTVTNCECREACLRNLSCVAYDWVTPTRSTNCWLGTNASEAALTPDQNNTHYELVNCTNSGERMYSTDLLSPRWMVSIFSVIGQVAVLLH